MNEQPYTNDPSLDRFLTEMNSGINDIKKSLGEQAIVNDKTLLAVQYTNGQVGELQKWRERMNGGAIVAGVFMTFIVVPILAWSVYTLVSLPYTIKHAVEESLTAYEKPYETTTH